MSRVLSLRCRRKWGRGREGETWDEKEEGTSSLLVFSPFIGAFPLFFHVSGNERPWTWLCAPTLPLSTQELMILANMTGCKLWQMAVLSRWNSNSSSRFMISAVLKATTLRDIFTFNCLEFGGRFSTLSLTVIFGIYPNFAVNCLFLISVFFVRILLYTRMQ